MKRFLSALLLLSLLGAASVEAQGTGSAPMVPTAPPTTLKETFGAQLRRLATAAQASNPVTNPVLIGAQPWIVSSGALTGSPQVVAQGSLWTKSGNSYYAAIGGTTGTGTNPTGTARNVTFSDGTVTWVYWGFIVGDVVSNGSGAFQVVTAGTPATTGGGPTIASLTDGSITWKYIGPQTAPIILPLAADNGSLSNQYSVMQGLSTAYAALADQVGPARWEGGFPSINNFSNGAWANGPNITPQTSGESCSGTFSGGIYTNCYYQSLTSIIEANIVLFQGANNTAAHSFIIDGRYVGGNNGSVGIFMNVFSGGTTRLQLDFTNVGGRAVRKITDEWSFGASATSINVAPTDHASYPDDKDNLGLGVLGSSESIATAASSVPFGWSNRFRYSVGLTDNASFALGATGLIAAGSNSNYITHGPGDLGRYNTFRKLNVILIEGPVNDTASSAANITAATVSLLTTLRTQFPGVLIVGVGSAFGTDNTTPGVANATDLAAENAYKAGFAAQTAAGDSLVGFVGFEAPFGGGGPIISGSGQQTNLTGPCSASTIASTSGNATYDISNGTPHPSDCGYLEWAKAIVPGYMAVINSLP